MTKENKRIKQSDALKGFLFRAAQSSGMTIKKYVILNLIQDLQRLSCLLRNSIRGRFQIKFGMTPLFNKEAFTLIELLVVVLIIGILAAIALPQYQKAVEKARAMEAIAILKILRDQQALCFLEHGIDDNRCEQGDGENNLFTMADVKLNITGAPDPDCGSPFCGPTSNDFSYELDGNLIYANRRPLGTKYSLHTTGAPDADTGSKILCSNENSDKNWCGIIGFTKEFYWDYIQP